MTDDVLDGNAASGALRRVLGVELTASIGRCAGCGREEPLAAAVAYVHAPGLVLRCTGCEGVLLRVVLGPSRAWLDLRGLQVIELPMDDAT
jgi:hypothetical protein